MRFNLSRRTNAGFTLVELLVVIAIIGILVALLLPAVQAAREAARRTQCKNQVKQMALACLLHESTHGFFPSGGWSSYWGPEPGRGFGKSQPGSWVYSLYPYTEQTNLHDLDLADTSGGRGFDVPANIRLLYTTAPDFLYCPSRRGALSYPVISSGFDGAGGSAQQSATKLESVIRTDYAANSGDALYSASVVFSSIGPSMVSPLRESDADKVSTWTNTNDPSSDFYQTGVSYYRSEIKFAQIPDGTSKTYLIGEKFMTPDMYDDPNNGTPQEQYSENQSALTGYEWDNHRVAWHPESAYDEEDYQPRQDRTDFANATLFAFGSAHSGGLNMAYCDGSVRMLSYDIDRDTHRLQAVRLDGGDTDYSAGTKGGNFRP